MSTQSALRDNRGDDRCGYCGSTERLYEITVTSFESPGRVEMEAEAPPTTSPVHEYRCEACVQAQVVPEVEAMVAQMRTFLESYVRTPLTTFDVDESCRTTAGLARARLASVGAHPSAAVAAFIAQYDPDGHGEAKAMRVTLPTPLPRPSVTDEEIYEAYLLLGSDDEEARQLTDDVLHEASRGNNEAFDLVLLIGVSLLSADAELRVHAYLREHRQWTDARFEEAVVLVRQRFLSIGGRDEEG